MRGFNKICLRLAAKAKLPSDVAPHVLQHFFASIAVDLGFSELTIAALLGQWKASVTSRYAIMGSRRMNRGAKCTTEPAVCTSHRGDLQYESLSPE
jgi:site-specific recombinase XerD